jgi:hypothetical protein
MRILTISCLISLFLVSCKALLLKKYKFNQEFKFQTKDEYLNYLQIKKKFNMSHVLYVDSNSNNNFANYIMDLHIAEYYGTLINDSTELKKSEKLQENLSCMGRVLTDINQNILKLSDTSLYIKNDFKKFQFRYVNSGELFRYDDSGIPLKIVLLYGYAFGTYYNDFYKAMNNFSAEHSKEAEVYIVALDYSYHFK